MTCKSTTTRRSCTNIQTGTSHPSKQPKCDKTVSSKSLTLTHFVIITISEAWYPALSTPQTVLGLWRVVNWNRCILHALLHPSFWTDSILDSQGPPVDRCGLLLFQGLQVMFREPCVDALLHFQGIPNFGGIFMKRHDVRFFFWRTNLKERENKYLKKRFFPKVRKFTKYMNKTKQAKRACLCQFLQVVFK